MKILLLEDNAAKRDTVKAAISEVVSFADIKCVENWFDYAKTIAAEPFDLILLDLMVPRSSRDPLVEDHHEQLVEVTRARDSLCFRTPAIVLTEYLDQSEEYFRDMNKVDINVISFDEQGEWKDALRVKLLAAQPKRRFDFLIVCALPKEVDAFETVVDEFGPLRTVSDLLCREIRIGAAKGAVIQTPRMGLVSAAVATSLAIERFDPSLVCMAGICGGAPNESKIYDLLISESCHQHDVGKWSDAGFKSEHYDVQIEPQVKNTLEELVSDRELKNRLKADLALKSSEFPEGMDELVPCLKIVATSSGSAVIAEAGKTSSLSVGQRKLAGFDMEVFALYEAARLSSRKPAFFAAKAVVDDGDKNKGDRFHRVGSILSAKFVAESIRSGIGGLRPK